MNKRSSSSKLFFYDLHGGGAKVQVMTDERYFCSSTSSYALIYCTVESYFVCIPVSKSSVFTLNLSIPDIIELWFRKKLVLLPNCFIIVPESQSLETYW